MTYFMTPNVTVTFVVGLTYFMTPKGHGVNKGRRDLIYDPKGHGDLCGQLPDSKGTLAQHSTNIMSCVGPTLAFYIGPM